MALKDEYRLVLTLDGVEARAAADEQTLAPGESLSIRRAHLLGAMRDYGNVESFIRVETLEITETYDLGGPVEEQM